MYSIQKAGIPFARCSRVRFVHTGYHSSAELRRKLKRNLGMVAGELFSHPRCNSLRSALADTWMGMGEYRKAIHAYKMLCDDRHLYEENPDIYVQAHLNIALSALRLSDARTARKYLYRALYLSPDRIEAKFHLGLMSEEHSDSMRAIDWYLDASRTPDSLRMTATNYRKYRMDSIVGLCRILIKSSRFEEACRVLSAAVEEFPASGELHALLGWCRIHREERIEALENFRKALRLGRRKGKTLRGMTFGGNACSKERAFVQVPTVR
jgi:tetratricopeptide (TPR) repeat protein